MSSDSYLALNAMLNLYGEDGELQLEADREAARQYFLNHVNPKTMFFHTLEEKIDYMTSNNYWSKECIEEYTLKDIKKVFKFAYDFEYRFRTFVGAYKFYTSYACKTYDGETYLERFEDRVCMVALYLAQGCTEDAIKYVNLMIQGIYQPATPTFLNAGRGDAGELVSCFLLRIEDNMESIGRAVNNSLQLSKRGGGVALLLSNLRESGAPIKKVEGASSGVVPVMKILEDSFSYANQLGARQGAGAVYLHAHHPDILNFLDTKRENADEKIRIKTLSLGVVIPDITFELARENKDMYLFSPYDVEREYGKPFSEVSVTEEYHNMVENPNIHKTKISARLFFQTIAEIQFESGYPYIMFEDTVNDANPISGRVNMSNLCVAPETRLLTDKGYYPISELAGQTVNAWNGEKFSPSFVDKTGENQELITVNFSNGASLDVTPYHKFYIQNEYGKKSVEVRAGELQEGDKLEKFELTPIDIPGAPTLESAYTAGLFTAEGTYGSTGKPILRLYGEKQELGKYIDYRTSSGKVDSQNRVSYTLNDNILGKFQVPFQYDIQSRLDWLAGLIDGDGYGNSAVGIQIVSINPEFLEELRVFLTTLGVHSTVALMRKAGETDFNDGYGPYATKDCYRLVVSGSEAQKLVELGLDTRRVTFDEYSHQRAARQFVKVTSVEVTGRVDDTYCLNEPELHKAVFEGIRTGNCSEILQVNQASVMTPDLTYTQVGQDISCNLGSINIAEIMDNGYLETDIGVCIQMLTDVSNLTNIDSVPTIQKANAEMNSVGLGQMNLHGYFMDKGITYGSPESLEFVDKYFAAVRYYALKASMETAYETGVTFTGFEDSDYADGSALEQYLDPENPIFRFEHSKVAELFVEQTLPTLEDWQWLNKMIQDYGLYHSYLLAVPPTGNISYVNGATSSIHPVTSPIEIRKEGKMGRVYYPAYGLTQDNIKDYTDAYEIGYKPIIDTYAEATKHTDQGLSLTLFFKDTATTRDINKAQIYAWRKGIKTLYYIRLRQAALEGTGVDSCVSCTL